MNRISPPGGEKAFSMEVSYLRTIRHLWKSYLEMGNSEKRAFLWSLGTWQEYRYKIIFYRIPPNLDKYPYRWIANNIDVLIADMLANCAGLEIAGRSVSERMIEFEEWIRKLDAVQEKRKVWY